MNDTRGCGVEVTIKIGNMPSQNTPPASPAMELPAELSAEDEEAAGGPLELDQEDIVEVIDLDELESWPEEIEVADEDDDEDDHHHHPQDQPMDRASAGSVVKPVVDLSERTFDKHAGEKEKKRLKTWKI